MSGEEDRLIVERLAEERLQGHATRKDLYVKLEKELGLPVVSFLQVSDILL